MRRHVQPIASLLLTALAVACSSSPEQVGSSQNAITGTLPGGGVINCGIFCRGNTPRTRGDVNGDQKADMILVGTGAWSTIPTALSTGDGHFTYVASTVTGDPSFGTYSLMGNARTVLGDFNADGLADIAVLGGLTTFGKFTSIPVAYGQANQHSFSAVNSSGASNTQLTQLAAQPGTQVVTADVNADYFDDLVIVGNGSMTYGLSNGSGGTFTMSVPHVASGGGYDPSIMANWGRQPGAKLLAGDFDGDGLGDVALVGGAGWGSIPVAFTRSGVSVHVTNTAIAQFAAWASSSGVTAVAGDFNGDKKTDIALIGGTGWTTVPVAFSNGDGSFRVTNSNLSWFNSWADSYVWSDNPSKSNLVRGAWFVAGDFNGDGKSDLALAGGGPAWGSIPVAFSNGDGTFGTRGVPTNDQVATFPSLATNQDAAVLSASSLPSATDQCGWFAEVTASRSLGGAVDVGFGLGGGPTRLRVAASRVPSAPFPNTFMDELFAPGNRGAHLEGLTNGANYWVQVSLAPLPWSNGVATCGSSPIAVPANPMGGQNQACFDDGTCNGGLVCVPESETFGNPGPECMACGGIGQPCCGGTTCEGNNGSGIVGCVGGKDLNVCQYTYIPAPPSSSGGGKTSGGATQGSGCENLTCYEVCDYTCTKMNGTYCSPDEAGGITIEDGCHACCDAGCMEAECTAHP